MKLTKKQKEVMKLVKNGADISNYGIAFELRAVQKDYPSLIRITKRMYEYDVLEKLPYFGAILTDDGKRVIK